MNIDKAREPLHAQDSNLAGSRFSNVSVQGPAFSNAACADAGGFTAVMPVLKVVDLQRSIEWYCGLLGMTLLWRKPMDGGGENCMLRHGAVTLMLSTGGHLGGKPAFTGTLYFNIADVAAFHERIRSSVQLAWPLEVMSYGTTEFGVRDPDGYVVAFASGG